MSDGRSARSIADLSAGLILATVTIAASPERVFRALTDPQELPRWWGADELYRTTGMTADLRPGGAWRTEGKGADGHAFAVGGEYIEVDPPHRLVMTWWPDWDEGHTTTVAYTLDAVDGGTRLTLRHEGFGDRKQSCADHGRGWERVLEWLDAYAAPRPESTIFMCRLVPPRPDFAMTLTAEEARAMKKHADYWRGMLAAGHAILFGPVADPAGPWGLGILRAPDRESLAKLTAADPAMTAGIGMRMEVLPMIAAVM